jgi:hypothetical protein
MQEFSGNLFFDTSELFDDFLSSLSSLQEMDRFFFLLNVELD